MSLDKPLAGKVVVTCNDEMAEVMARVVDMMGGEGIAFRSIKKARDYLAAHQSGVDCAVIDLLMLDGNGANLIRELRLTHPSLACVLVSGYSLDVVQKEALASCVFLGKPFAAEELAAKILLAIGQAQTERPGRPEANG